MGDVMELWNDFEACTVEGRYPLGKLVRTEGRRAWFETQMDDAQPALIILTESLNDEEVLLDRLHAAMLIQHPNVVSIHAAGVTDLNDTPLVYAVTERTEENLDDVLRERPLSSEEAGELLDGLLPALAAIHARRLVHGRMEPANVLAAGDTIKLRSDCIHAIPEDGSFEKLASEDVRGLGTILFRALTLRLPENALDPAIPRLPAPFAQIVQRSLSGLATTAEIEALLRPIASSPVAPAAKPPAAQARKAQPATVAPTSVAKPASVVSESVPAPEVQRFREEPSAKPDAASKQQIVADAEADPTARWNNPRNVVAAFIVLLALAGYLVYITLKSPVNTAATVTNTMPTPAAAQPAPKRHGSQVILPLQPSTAPAPSPSGTAVWRVIAYTYNRQDEAEHKARSIAEKHAEWQPQVFAPRGNRAPFFVALGGPMDRDQAIQLREKARRSGLPRDTFARNFR